MLYLKDFGDKINNNLSLLVAEKLDILRHIVIKEVQLIVSKVEAKFDQYIEPECINTIGDYTIQTKIWRECDTDNTIRSYFRDNDLSLYKEARLDHIIISEYLYQLKV